MDKKLVDAINKQLNYEFESAHVYLAMQAYVATTGLEGFESWLGVQYDEEIFHARKFIKFLNDRGEKAVITGFGTPRADFSSILEVFETALEHEKGVTSRINNLMKIAHEVHDYASISFLQWYVDEQVEEEDSFNKLIDKIKLLDNKDLFMLDKDLGTRTFVPPTNE